MEKIFQIGFLLAAGVLAGCATTGAPVTPEPGGQKAPKAEARIIRAETGAEISFEELMADLCHVRVIYAGERHTDPRHHQIQAKILRGLHQQCPQVALGMEMFDRTYGEVLADWSAGRLTEAKFLQQTHWYANWKYDFDLYREILEYVRENRIPLYGLNIPFHIPPKVSIGGIESLSPEEKNALPEKIDTQNPDHRAYLEEVYKSHQHMLKGRENFEYFYEAQNVWEDVMAESIAQAMGEGSEDLRMLVTAGNGHILNRFGIPERAYARTGLPYATVIPVSADRIPEPDAADYFWALPPLERDRQMPFQP